MCNPTRKQAVKAEDDFMTLHGSRGSCALYQCVLAIEALCKAPSQLFQFCQKKWRATLAARHSNSLNQ